MQKSLDKTVEQLQVIIIIIIIIITIIIIRHTFV